jgi:hypothetical protein
MVLKKNTFDDARKIDKSIKMADIDEFFKKEYKAKEAVTRL